jgi:hypothetical protein
VKTTLSLMFVALSLASMAQAQQTTSFPPPAQGGLQAQHHASTLQEGILRGYGDLYRGVGEYNYNTAAAALIFESAKKANYENQLKHAETFWAKRALHASYQAALRPTPVRPKVESKAAIQAALQRSAPFDLTQPGAWPLVLRRPEFEPSRNKLIALFKERTPQNSGAASDNFSQIRDSLQQVRAGLSELVKEVPPSDFVDARQFLDRVAVEAARPVGTDGALVAAR